MSGVKLVDRSIEVIPLHSECPTYVVHPKDGIQLIKKPAPANVGDLIVAGTVVVSLRSGD